jgi:septal ring factor EnvC (AmiA/AmiB activator)
MTPDEIRKRIENVLRRTEVATKRKASLEGTLKAKEQELAVLLQEIREAGYKPKELVSERDRVQAELLKMLEDYEQRLTEVETALATFE